MSTYPAMGQEGVPKMEIFIAIIVILFLGLFVLMSLPIRAEEQQNKKKIKPEP